jgi:hypothetical protein
VIEAEFVVDPEPANPPAKRKNALAAMDELIASAEGGNA